MNWLNEQYANERYQDARREAECRVEANALLAESQPPAESNRIRQAVGGKLIEWGKRLQDDTNTVRTLDGARG